MSSAMAESCERALVDGIDDTWASLESDLDRFDRFLEGIAS